MGTRDLDEFVRPLARKIAREQFIPFVAAGLSVSWGNQTAGNLASSLFDRFQEVAATVKPDLIDEVANQIGATRKPSGRTYETKEFGRLNEVLCDPKILGKRAYLRCIWSLGAPAARRWPWLTLQEGADLYQAGFPVIGDPHLLIGRLAKEGVIREVFTPNFDTLIELGCWATGIVRAGAPDEVQGADAFKVIADHEDFVTSTPFRNVLRIVKIHGCAEKIIKGLEKAGDRCWCAPPNPNAPPGLRDKTPPTHHGCQLFSGRCFKPETNFVITNQELLDWRKDNWARDLLTDRLRNHNMLFLGFSGVDPVLHATMRQISGEVTETLESAANKGDARLFAIDRTPQFSLFRLTSTDARAVQPLLQVDGWISGTETRDDLEAVSQMLYGQTMLDLLGQLLAFEGQPWAMQNLQSNCWAHARAHLTQLRKWVQEELDPVSKSADRSLLWYGLPGAVAASWRCQFAPTGLTPRRDGLPVNLPQHYVSLRKHPELTIPALRFHHFLRQELAPVPNSHLRYSAGGWITVEFERKRHALLPLVLPERSRGAAVAVIDRYVLNAAPPVPERPRIVLLTPDKDGQREILSNLASQLSRQFTVRPFAPSQLWSSPSSPALNCVLGGA